MLERNLLLTDLYELSMLEGVFRPRHDKYRGFRSRRSSRVHRVRGLRPLAGLGQSPGIACYSNPHVSWDNGNHNDGRSLQHPEQ
jgi:hypothetical protein